MTKGIRILLSIGAVCAILGLVLSVAGFCMGGRPTSIHVHWDHGPRITYRDTEDSGLFGFVVEDTPKAPSAPDAPSAPEALQAPAAPGADASAPRDVRELEVEVGAGRVEIVTGDAYALRVQGGPRYESACEDGAWRISTEDHWNSAINWNNVVFTITVPSDAQLEELSLTVGAGTLTADALSCREAELTVGAGTITLSELFCTGDCDIEVGVGTLHIDGGALTGETDVKCGMGDVRVQTQRPSSYGYAVSGGMGSVSIDGNQFSGMGIDAKQNSGANVFYNIDCGMGSVEVAFLD